MSPTRPVQRVAAHVLIRDGGSVLLVRGALPGVVVGHGEHPRAAALRSIAGLLPAGGSTPRPVRATSEVADLPGGPRHTLHLIYEVRARGVRGVHGVDRVPAAGFADRPPTLGAPGPAPEYTPLGREGELPVVVQRPAAYALLTDRPGQLLLTHLAGSDGLWTLPGGGIDFGEDPVAALTREVHEETGLSFTPGPLRDVLSRHFTGRAPSGRLEDFHGVSLLFDGSVPADVVPRVVEVGGSTDVAAWHPLPGLGGVRAAASVHEAVRIWRRRRSR